ARLPLVAFSIAAGSDDLDLIGRLRAREEAAFMMLVERLQPALIRVARMYVQSQAVAEEVAQETWLGVLQGIDRFEGRSSLRTWIFRICTNIAKTRGQREGRSTPFATLAGEDLDAPSLPESLFQGPNGAYPNHWSSLPADWTALPQERLDGAELRRVIGSAIEGLPPMQAEVIRLRDVLGWTSEEVRNALDISETNQRVLLHRARAKVRSAVESYLESA
ncbi:MAG: sigma-70 family RNA polymerase sigma factor, partial [Actinomycetota bacterium]